MYAFTARFHSLDGEQPPPDIAHHVQSIADPDNGLEHIYTQATPFGVYAVLFVKAAGVKAAESAAVGVCREALRRAELAGWCFTWQGPERQLNPVGSW